MLCGSFGCFLPAFFFPALYACWNEIGRNLIFGKAFHIYTKLREAAKCSNMIFKHNVVVCCALALKFRRYMAHVTIYWFTEIIFNCGVSVLKLTTRRIERWHLSIILEFGYKLNKTSRRAKRDIQCNLNSWCIFLMLTSWYCFILTDFAQNFRRQLL